MNASSSGTFLKRGNIRIRAAQRSGRRILGRLSVVTSKAVVYSAFLDGRHP